MNIYELTQIAKVDYFKRGTNIHMSPDKGDLSWNWSTVMDTGVDIVYSLDDEYYAGAVSLTLSEKSGVKSVEVYCDSLCSGRYDAETGKTVNGNIEIPVGVSAKEIKIRLNAYLLEIGIEYLSICGTKQTEHSLYPTPEAAVFGNDSIFLSDISDICGNSFDTDIDFSIKHLKNRITEYYGNIFDGKGIKIILEKCNCIPQDGYSLSVRSDGVLIKAADKRGLLYGCETFFQLIKDGVVPTCEINDKPYKELRGFHFFLPPRENMEFAKRVLKYLLLPMKYNILFIEFCGGMRFDRHPEISEAWLQGNNAAKAGLQPTFPHGRVADGQLLEKK